MVVNTLGELIKRSSENFKNNPALGFVGEVPVTYGEFTQKIDAIVALLEKQGVEKGDKIAILSSNQPNWGITYFALASMGVTVVPILPDFSEQEIENVLNHAEVKAIFVSEGLYRKVVNFKNELLKFIVLIDVFAIIPEGMQEKDILSLETALEEGVKPNATYQVDKDDLASIIYTSGTTGKSKGVMLTHKNLIFSAEKSGKIHPMNTTDCMLSVLPLSHTYENTIGLILPLMFGTAVYYLRKPPVPSVLLPAMKLVKPTLMLTVPLIIEKVYKGKILPEINSKSITRTLYKIPVTRKVLNLVAGKKLYLSLIHI